MRYCHNWAIFDCFTAQKQPKIAKKSKILQFLTKNSIFQFLEAKTLKKSQKFPKRAKIDLTVEPIQFREVKRYAKTSSHPKSEHSPTYG